ncbi:hypothetical protein BC832DRAFT_547980 [Gaertneriomyces semiglobifer]|nr:hypothetical protein BC832DRAFT_547980 [Gaertneriomyces semiglobifer]
MSLQRSSSSLSSNVEPPCDTPGALVTRRLVAAVDQDTVEDIVAVQSKILRAMRQTNGTLESHNQYSAQKFSENVASLNQYTKLLKDMKGDLDVIFRRIRALKLRAATHFPEQYAGVTSTAEPDNPDEGE